MKKHIPWHSTLFVILTSTTAAAIPKAALCQQSSAQISQSPVTPESQDAYAWQRVPVKIGIATDHTSSQILSARGDFFDRLIGNDGPLDQPQTLGSGHSEGGEVQEEFPSSQADAVITGTFVGSAPHLSPSRKSIYTAVQMKVNEIAFAKKKTLVRGSLCTVLIPGGTVVLPGTDRVISDGVPRSKFGIAKGHRYLLFLRYHPDGDFFTIRKTWLVQDGKLIPNSVTDFNKAQRNLSHYANRPETQVVQELKSGSPQ